MDYELIVMVPLAVTMSRDTTVINVNWKEAMDSDLRRQARWSVKGRNHRLVVTHPTGVASDRIALMEVRLPDTTIRYGYPRGERIPKVNINVQAVDQSVRPDTGWSDTIEGTGYFTIDQLISMLMIEHAAVYSIHDRSTLIVVAEDLRYLAAALGKTEHEHALDAVLACLKTKPANVTLQKEDADLTTLVNLSNVKYGMFITIPVKGLLESDISDKLAMLKRARSINPDRIIKRVLDDSLVSDFIDDYVVWNSYAGGNLAISATMVEVNDIINELKPRSKQNVLHAAELFGAQITYVNGEYLISCQ